MRRLIAAAFCATLTGTAWAGAQKYEDLTASVRAGLHKQVSDQAAPFLAFDTVDEARAWLDAMSKKLERRITDRHTREEFLVTVHYEAKRAGLDPQLVLGLIQVMKNLANIEEVGHGIAVAFVATVYGVASANIFFLPAGAKIKARVHKVIQNRELMLEGVVGIVEGLNPKLIRSKLEAYAGQAPVKKDAKAPKAGKAPAQAAAAEG